jgi:hypothetical protein
MKSVINKKKQTGQTFLKIEAAHIQDSFKR